MVTKKEENMKDKKFERLAPETRTDSILSAAAIIAESGGFASLNHKSVSLKADCSVPTINLRIGNKEQLIAKTAEYVMSNPEGLPRAHIESYMMGRDADLEGLIDLINNHLEEAS